MNGQYMRPVWGWRENQLVKIYMCIIIIISDQIMGELSLTSIFTQLHVKE